MMHVMRYFKEDRLWTVGYYDPNNNWHPVEHCETSDEAANRVHYYNGGNGPQLEKLGDILLERSLRIIAILENFTGKKSPTDKKVGG